MKQLAIAFTGPSGSGKTTLIEKLAKEMVQRFKIAIIKHDPKDKAVFDNPLKDSGRFFNTNADVAVVSDKKTTVFKHQSASLIQLSALLSPYDFLFVEGLKEWNLPRIAIFREKIDESYLPYINAVAIDNSVPQEQINKLDLTILDLNNTDEVIDYILKNAIAIKGE